jgi:2-oxoglutarate ferredoxin oxidoreductase subunit delta
MVMVKIDKNLCKGCELCVPVCHYDSLGMAKTLNDYGLPPAYFKKGFPCSGCRHCAIMCPEAAIEIITAQ